MPIIRSSRLNLYYCCIWCVMLWLLVVGCATQESHNFPHPGRIACCCTPNSRPPTTKALHTICGNNTRWVSSSWWWAYECPKHFEQIIIAIKHSVASSWFSYLRLYYDARTNKHQIQMCQGVIRNVLIFKKYNVKLSKKACPRQSLICLFVRAKPGGLFLDCATGYWFSNRRTTNKANVRSSRGLIFSWQWAYRLHIFAILHHDTLLTVWRLTTHTWVVPHR